MVVHLIVFGIEPRKPQIEPDLERRILSEPDVKDAIEIVAEKNKIGENPILEYLREQLKHAFYHADKRIWGKTKDEHPKLKYASPKHIPEATRRYFGNLGISVPYHLKSFFVGTDSDQSPGADNVQPTFGEHPCFNMREYIGEQLSHAAYHTEDLLWFRYDKHPKLKYASLKSNIVSLWQKIEVEAKLFGPAAKEFPGCMKKVFKKINSDAKIMRTTGKSKFYLRNMAASIEPEMLGKTRARSKQFVEGSFSEVVVSGLEDKIHDGKSVADLLHQGGCLIYQNHPSYSGLPINFYVFEKVGLDNLFTIAGSNIVRMKNREMAEEFKVMVKGSGAVLVERDLPMDPTAKKVAYLYYVLLKEYIGDLLSKGANILLYSNGREKGCSEADVKSILADVVGKARYIIPSAQAHDIIPDDNELAFGESSKHGASLDTLLALQKDDKGQTFFRVYVTYGKPRKPSEYLAPSLSGIQGEMTNRIKNAITADMSESVQRLVTFTPTYVLAAAVNGLERFTIEQVLDSVKCIVNHAKDNELPISPELANESYLQSVMYHAAAMLCSRGALRTPNFVEYEVGKREGPMLTYYAAKIERMLNCCSLSKVGKR